MGEGRPIPVRLAGEIIERLNRASKKTYLCRAAIIRMCLESWLEHTSGRPVEDFPVEQWQAMLKSTDGRRLRRKRKAK